MKKLRQILAFCAILILAGMYVSTFVFSLLDDPKSFTLLRASIGATIVIPVMLWVLLLFIRLKSTDASSPSFSDDADYDSDDKKQ
ncbi:hypothetical protein SAMN05216391_101246 [Lachnospiraceae bacterium KHCPX20]|nr:hypothetical protein SAMN05216391_101246 [Lachnospiraceae bacterium KHCPX20]